MTVVRPRRSRWVALAYVPCLIMMLCAAIAAGETVRVAEGLTDRIARDGYEANELRERLAAADYILIYYGAIWCSYCPGFESRLKAITKGAKRIEIVFVSHDVDEERYAEHAKKLGYMSVRFDVENYYRRDPWIGRLGRRSLPGLIVLTPDGKTAVSSYTGDKWNTPDHVFNRLKRLLKE